MDATTHESAQPPVTKPLQVVTPRWPLWLFVTIALPSLVWLPICALRPWRLVPWALWVAALVWVSRFPQVECHDTHLVERRLYGRRAHRIDDVVSVTVIRSMASHAERLIAVFDDGRTLSTRWTHKRLLASLIDPLLAVAHRRAMEALGRGEEVVFLRPRRFPWWSLLVVPFEALLLLTSLCAAFDETSGPSAVPGVCMPVIPLLFAWPAVRPVVAWWKVRKTLGIAVSNEGVRVVPQRGTVKSPVPSYRVARGASSDIIPWSSNPRIVWNGRELILDLPGLDAPLRLGTDTANLPVLISLVQRRLAPRG